MAGVASLCAFKIIQQKSTFEIKVLRQFFSLVAIAGAFGSTMYACGSKHESKVDYLQIVLLIFKELAKLLPILYACFSLLQEAQS